MKIHLILIIILCTGQRTMAQDDSLSSHVRNEPIIRCVPSKQNLLHPPLYVIKSHNQSLCFIDTSNTKPSSINPQWIKKIDIYKDAIITMKNYGEAGKNGVVEITINDDKYPDAFKLIQTATKKGQP